MSETQPMLTRYRFEPRRSRFTVQAFTTGFLSFLGHSPTFAVRDFSGHVAFENDLVSTMRAELTVGAKSLDILDKLKPADRQEIEKRMFGDVLGASDHPQIVFRTETVATERVGNGHYRVALDGTLALRGLSRQYPINGELSIFKDGVRLKGGARLRMSDFGIQPVSALAGTIQLKDEVVLSFDLAASQVAT